MYFNFNCFLIRNFSALISSPNYRSNCCLSHIIPQTTSFGLNKYGSTAYACQLSSVFLTCGSKNYCLEINNCNQGTTLFSLHKVYFKINNYKQFCHNNQFFIKLVKNLLHSYFLVIYTFLYAV